MSNARIGSWGLMLSLGLSLSSAAHAADVCEIAKPSLKPLGFSKKYLQFAVKRTVEFCDPAAPDVEHTWSFIEVYTLDGALKRRFRDRLDEGLYERLRQDPAARTRLPQAIATFLAGEVLSKEQIDAHLADGAFQAVEATKSSPNRKCTLKAMILSQDSGGVPTKHFAVVLHVGDDKKTLFTSKEAYTGKLELEFRWYELPKEKRRKHAHAIGFTLRESEGWAPGSPGSVYSASFQVLRAAELAPCF